MENETKKEEKQIQSGVFLSQTQFHKKTAGSTIIGKSVMRRMGAITAVFLSFCLSVFYLLSLISPTSHFGVLSSPHF